MEGVTTAITAFIFVCIIYPHLVKHKPQYYGALVFLIAIIVLDVFRKTESIVPALLVAMLQVGAIILLILATGGLSARELAGEMLNAYEVIRRGEETKTVIVPLSSQQMKKEPEDKVVFEVDPEVAKEQMKQSNAPKPASPDQSLPLE